MLEAQKREVDSMIAGAKEVDSMTTGEKIAALRREAALSQEALADRLGISRQAVSKWEADQAVPTMDNLMELSRIFGVSVDSLLRPDSELPTRDDVQGETAGGNGAPPQSPGLSKRAKGCILVLVILLCAGAVCNAVTLVWLGRLQREVDAIPRGSSTIYVPTPSIAENAEELGEMADVRVDYALAASDPTQLSLQISAMPREVDADETAQFSIQGGAHSMTVDAVYENGYYTGGALLPLADCVSIYLLLHKDGTTRNLLVKSLTELENQFGLDVALEFDEGSGLHWSAGQGSGLTGRLVIKITSHGAPPTVYPVSGRVVLYVNGKEYDSVPVDDITARKDEWLDPEIVGYATMYYYVDLPWKKINAPVKQITWGVELIDSLGRVMQYEI